MKYENECYLCGHKWISITDFEDCPECGEGYDIGTNTLNEETNQSPKIQ